MGFARAPLVQSSSPEQESKFVLGAQPLMASNKSNNFSTQSILDQQHHHYQQQQQQQQLFQQIQAAQHQHQQNNNQTSFGIINSSSSSSGQLPNNFISKDGGGYDLGELDQALFMYLDGQDPSAVQDQRQSGGMRIPTLNIFPSQPMHVEPSSAKGNTSTELVSPATSGSKRSSEPSMKLSHPKNDVPPSPQQSKAIKREGNKKGPTSSSEQEGPKTPDPKTLRRLAQNREAARKSRLRKKAYVRQLESSKIKLTQLEQELQRVRAQGFYLGGGAVLGPEQGLPLSMANMSSDAAVFDMEYARWLEEHHRLMCELRAAVQEHLPENELRLFVNNCLAHYDEVMNLKSMVAKTDVFHLVSGSWKTPAERCFMWMGGFRPSEIMKVCIADDKERHIYHECVEFCEP